MNVNWQTFFRLDTLCVTRTYCHSGIRRLGAETTGPADNAIDLSMPVKQSMKTFVMTLVDSGKFTWPCQMLTFTSLAEQSKDDGSELVFMSKGCLD